MHSGSAGQSKGLRPSKFMRWAGLFFVLLSTACNDDRIAKLEKQTSELQQQVATLQKTGQLDLQAQCAKDAKNWFDSNWGRPDKDTILLNFTNHYSATKNKCFINVEYHYSLSNSTIWYNDIQIYDVYENQRLGEIAEEHNINETKTQRCAVFGTMCKSIDEFSTLARQFMSN